MISLSVVLTFQIALVVHVLRTGRAIYWIYLIMFLPVIGSIAYFIVELLPDLSGAERQYREVSTYFAGAEARFRYARLLERLEKIDTARTVYEDIVNTADLSPRHYKRIQRRWIRAAKDGLGRLAAAAG